MSARIMLIDDDRNVTHAIASWLKRKGFQVLEVNDAASALAQARAFEPDAVVLDFEMPGMNGADVARQFAADARLRDVPMLIASGVANTIPRCTLPSERVPVVAKPFPSTFLLSWLRSHLEEVSEEPAVPQ